ncbi:glucose 1-dehydrogenase [Rhizobium lusitanum]|uniref:Glucose 1-dehydrogenase n=1 Tax=Rhizobium lusitanum TaxID=293958 RepID=A0A6L9UIE0_9HYPH|nr:SDR family oxidoreductase [Rhizobium lusitanum]NEI73640.1 glucose 1-dehydrogenase [Rhizobium lusitanum]
MLLKDRIALVTGGASGLGYATATAFAREGATVVINDLRVDAAREAAARLGEKHFAVGGDVSSEADVQAMVEAALVRFGRIDILVNNAGMPDSFTPTVDQTLAHWQRLIDVHLTGTYLVSKTVAASMIAQKSGVILNLNSIAGLMGLPVRTAYSAAKAGIGMLTQVLGCEWGPHNIRVNAIAPGYILTPLTKKLIAEGKIEEKRIRRRTPMGKMGSAEDIAEAMVFLASDRAEFITAITLPVDGGYCSWGAPSDAFPLD